MLNRRHALLLSVVAIVLVGVVGVGCAALNPSTAEGQRGLLDLAKGAGDAAAAAGGLILPGNPAIGGGLLALGSLVSWAAAKGTARLAARRIAGGPIVERRQQPRGKDAPIWSAAKRAAVLQLLSDPRDVFPPAASAPRAPGGRIAGASPRSNTVDKQTSGKAAA